MHRLRSWIASHRAISLRLAALALAALGLWLVAAAAARRVTLVVDGERRVVATHARRVGGLLREVGLRPTAEDFVVPPPDAPLRDGAVVEVRLAHLVRLEVDGHVDALTTPADHPENILFQAGVRLFPGDRAWVDGLPLGAAALPARGVSRIRVERAYSLSLRQGGGNRPLRSAGATLGEALWEAGIPLRAADEMFPPAGTSLEGGTGVRYEPARAITVEADGTRLRSWAAAETVGEALAAAGVALVGLDYAVPAVASPLPDDGTLRVVRVTESVELDRTLLPFSSRWEPAPEIEIDRQQLIDAGEAGVVARRARVRYEDGVEVGRTTEPEWVAVAPRDRVMGYGTKIVIRTLNTPDGPIEYWRAVPMYATSYSPCRLGVPNYCSTTMANGEQLQKGHAAFIVRWYRVMRGQYVYVPGYGRAKISDTGGGIPGRRWIDLGYSDSDYVSWHQWVTVYFLTPVPPEGLILWVLE